MNTFKNIGNRISYTNSGSAISSGATVIVRSGTSGITGVAVTDIAATTGVGELALSGVHTLPKEAGAIAYGGLVYRKSSNGNITTATTGNTLAGFAVAAATTSATTVDVLLNGLPGSN